MATKVKVPKAAIPVAYATLRDLLGKPIDDPAVVALCAAAGKVTMKPEYLIAKEAGFDYALSKPANRGVRKVLSTLFLYINEGRDNHRRFDGVPHGLAYDMPRADVLAKLGAPRVTWKVGPGKVPVTTANPSHDSFDLDGVEVTVFYKGAKVSSIQVTRADLRELR